MESTGIKERDSQTLQTFITSEQLLEHWQGHRRLTRKVIEAFPEEEFFKFSIGGMRTFAELVMEMCYMAAPGIDGVVTGKWEYGGDLFDPNRKIPATKKEILDLWDKITGKLDSSWPDIAEGRFQENDVAFGQYEGKIYWTMLYFVDNEIHHRGQGYVYLRALGIEPPPFWER